MRMINGECLYEMDRLIQEGVRVDMILTDIPYGTTKCKWDSVISLDDMWEKIKKIRKITTPTLLFGQAPFDKILGTSNIKELKYEWIWEKTSATGHLNAKKMPMKAHENILAFHDIEDEDIHENILVFYKKLGLYNPQMTYNHKRKTSKAEHKIKCKESDIYNKGQVFTTYDSTTRYPRSVLKFSSDKQTCNLHPAQKPVALLEYLIETYTNEGDLVLDFTAGSFSTGEACWNLKRDCILIEKDEDIFNTGKNRIEGIRHDQKAKSL